MESWGVGGNVLDLETPLHSSRPTFLTRQPVLANGNVRDMIRFTKSIPYVLMHAALNESELCECATMAMMRKV